MPIQIIFFSAAISIQVHAFTLRIRHFHTMRAIMIYTNSGHSGGCLVISPAGLVFTLMIMNTSNHKFPAISTDTVVIPSSVASALIFIFSVPTTDFLATTPAQTLSVSVIA